MNLLKSTIISSAIAISNELFSEENNEALTRINESVKVILNTSSNITYSEMLKSIKVIQLNCKKIKL